MLLCHSFRRKVMATCGAALGFALLHEARVLDSQSTAAETELLRAAATPSPGATVRVDATAYCRGEVTAAGTPARTGVAAADPTLLPVGSVVKVEDLGPRYDGIYTVMDTGPAVRGREVDLYMWSCQEAQAFGRRQARLTVIRLGWNPRASSSSATALRLSEPTAAPGRAVRRASSPPADVVPTVHGGPSGSPSGR